MTFLFTDIEGSILLWEAHRDAMQGALALHDTVLRDAIDAAVTGQLALQRADWGATGRLKVRMAIHTGSAEERDGNYFGPPLNRCARILSAADGDEVLVSLTTQQLVRGNIPSGTKLVDIGELRLKDLGLSDRVFQLTHPDLITELKPEPRDVGRHLRGYELIENIGEGGFGVVYRAKQAGVGREVAIKVARAELANDPEFIRRFDTEAQLVARLEHPYVVPLYDYWREPDGAYLVMRWLKGGNLKTALRTGPWKLDAIARLLRQVGGALALAHRRGVIHRDIKPANILLDEEGNAYLSDFGIAYDISHDAQLEALDASTSWPAYSSPEQLRREPASHLADIYSLGMVLHELVTGDYPFGDATPTELLKRQLAEPLPDVSSLRSSVPADLDQVINRATASHPADRYPDVETLIAAVEVLIGSPGTRTAPVAIEIRNPYEGLRAFQQTDNGDFFGREALTEQIVETLQQHRLVAVVGPSGSGKSSVVKAGVLPMLRSGSVAGWDTWFFSEMVPGTRPFEELEAALLRVAVNPPATLLEQLRTDDHGLLRAVKRILPEGDTELVLVIDQFEEIFSHVTDKEMRKQFLAGLRAAAADVRSRLRIIITLRADFFDQPLLYPEFADLLKAGLVPVTPLSGDELERAIIEPGHQARISFDPGLVGDIVSNVSDQPGALPLLQYALSELHERHDNGSLTSHAYTDIGGVAGALGMRAEELFAELDEAGRESARQVFLRLVTLGEGTGDTRRRALREELTTLGTDANGVATVLDTFGESRLLSFDRDPLSRGSTVEVAHEAPLTEWRRLRDWIDSGRDDLRMHRSLAVTAEEWVGDDRDTSFLLGGARLERIETWMETSGIDLAAREREYVDASISQRVAQEQASREQREREAALERRALSRLRGLVAVLAVAALVAGGLTLFAVNEHSKAEEQRQAALTESERAQVQTRIATARGLASAAIANLDVDPERSILLALRGVDETRSRGEPVLPEVVDALHRALQATRFEQLVQPANSGTYSADGKLLVTAGFDGVVRVWDVTSYREVLHTRSAHEGRILDVALSLDGTLLATGGEDGTARIWDAASGLLLRTIRAGDGNLVQRVAFSPDGLQLAASSSDGEVRGWEGAGGEERARFTVGLTPDGAADVVWSSDGATLATTQGVLGSSTVLWDVATGQKILEIRSVDGAIYAVAVNRDETRLVTGSAAGGASVWDVTGEPGSVPTDPLLRLEGHTDIVCRVAFSPDGGSVATASDDGTVKLWDSSSGRELFSLAGHTGPVFDLSFSPDGRYLFSSGVDGRGRVWDVSASGSREVATTATETAAFAVAYSPRGDQIAFYSGEGVQLWQLPAGVERRPTGLPQIGVAPASVAFAPDGDYVFATGTAGTVKVWAADTGLERATLRTPADVLDISVSPDGSFVAVAGSDGVARILDLDSGEVTRELAGPDNSVDSVTFNSDGSLLAVGGDSGLVTLWETAGGTQVRVLDAGLQFVFALAFSPDGSWLASGGPNSTITVFDVDTVRPEVLLRGHAGPIRDIEFGPEGSTIGSASSDGTTKLWDAASGAELLSLSGSRDAVTGLAFSPDGKRLVTSSIDRTVRIYALDLDDLMSLARDRLTRDLEPAECRQYLGLDNCPPST